MLMQKAGEPGAYPNDWPPEDYYVQAASVKAAVSSAFAALLERDVTETEADTFLRGNPAFVCQCLNFTRFGHHGMWVIPQKLVDPGGVPDRKGLKPDYLFGGKGSDGFFWCVAELKGPRDKIFKRARDKRRTICFSAASNRGICQLLQYMDYCSSNQAYFRDHFHLTNFREPRGFLIIGREAELEGDAELQELKSAWNRHWDGQLMIRTYDALLRSDSASFAEVENNKLRGR